MNELGSDGDFSPVNVEEYDHNQGLRTPLDVSADMGGYVERNDII